MLLAAVSQSDIVVTCTPLRKPYLMAKTVRNGTFIAAVGADSPDKQELECALVGSCKVVADLIDQADACWRNSSCDCGWCAVARPDLRRDRRDHRGADASPPMKLSSSTPPARRSRTWQRPAPFTRRRFEPVWARRSIWQVSLLSARGHFANIPISINFRKAGSLLGIQIDDFQKIG